MAEGLGEPVSLYTGLPVGSQRNGAAVVAVNPRGQQTWRPYVTEVRYPPAGAPVVSGYRVPVPGLVERNPGVYDLGGGVVLEVVPSGLWVREAEDNGPEVRSLPVDPEWARLTVGTPGRTTAAHALEDHGWYVVENLPPQLLTTLTELVARTPGAIPKLAVVMDVRSKALFPALRENLQLLRAAGVDYRVLFLDASDEQLDFPTLYASGRAGYAGLTDDVRSGDLTPMFDTIVANVPPPRVDAGPFKIDSVNPVITLRPAGNDCSAPGDNGWCRGTQTAGFTATDATSGFAPSAVTSDPPLRFVVADDDVPHRGQDGAALEERKEHKPANSAIDMASEMGIELLTEEEYRALQKLGKFDTKTSSWVETPPDIRERGGAIFCDRRYDRVFTYHNGAESYYAARGFRGSTRRSMRATSWPASWRTGSAATVTTREGE